MLELVDLGYKREALVTSLSRGMTQRLGLARVLLHDPQVLLLDEPASGLDPRARIEIRGLLKELRNMGKTIMVSSHILPELADICNKVGIIERGELHYNDTVDELMKLVRQRADIVCLQEIKAQAADLAVDVFRPKRFHAFFHCAGKKGYSGVALYTKRTPDQIVEGLGIANIDAEGRYLRADFGALSVVSLYLPSGSSSEERQAAKFGFMQRFLPVLEELRANFAEGPAARYFEFLSGTKRGIVQERRAPRGATIKLRTVSEENAPAENEATPIRKAA